MHNKPDVEKLIDDALSSIDHVSQATAKPFLFTRLKARMDREHETVWEKAIRIIARPSVVVAGLCMIICINAMVIAYNNTKTQKYNVSDQLATTDEFSTSVTALIL